jgi:hypothetical protein
MPDVRTTIGFPDNDTYASAVIVARKLGKRYVVQKNVYGLSGQQSERVFRESLKLCERTDVVVVWS